MKTRKRVRMIQCIQEQGGHGMEIKAVMCDVDGTLLNSKGVVSPRTIEAIKKVREKGIVFGLCTGRDTHSVKTLLEHWGVAGLVDAIIGNGGSEIYDEQLGVEKASYPLDGALIKEIVAHYEDMDVNFAIPYEGVIVAPKDDELIRFLAEVDHVPYRVANYDEFLMESKAKIMIVCEEGYMGNVIERSKSFHNDQYKCASLVTASVLYEYMDPRVSKANGLKEFMELHGWEMNQLCTFGDEDNDYDMTAAAGVGVVMANGSKKTKSVADFITEDLDHDGIAVFLEEHIL